MAKEEMVNTLDYILNRSSEQEIEVLAAAVIRRRRDIAMYGSMPVAPDPKKMAEEISSQFNLEGSIEGMKNSIRDYAIRIIRQEAPELTEAQIEELTGAWIPGSRKTGNSSGSFPGSAIPKDMLSSMIGQFTSFSLGRMDEEEDQSLRREMGAWPEKYWKSFPEPIQQLLTEFIKGKIDESYYNSKMDKLLKL